MSRISIVGLSGNITRLSKTKAFVNYIVTAHFGDSDISRATFDIDDLGPSFPSARRSADLDRQAQAIIEQVSAADILVAGSPTYKGSYTGLFKHFFDLLDPASLKGKPVILAATGGGERHSLIVEHQLRPLFGFFEAFAVPTAIYASDKDFNDGSLTSESIRQRVQQAADEASRVVEGPRSVELAA